MRRSFSCCSLLPLLTLLVAPTLSLAQGSLPAVPWPATDWETDPLEAPAAAPRPPAPLFPGWVVQDQPAAGQTPQPQTPSYIRPLPQVPRDQQLPAPLETVPVPPPTAEMFAWDQPLGKPPARSWEASIELGLNGTGGNTDTFNVQLGANFEQELPRSTYTLEVDYTNNSSGGVTTANRHLTESRYEWSFSEKSRWDLYVHGTLELDSFKAFDQRIATDMGLGYLLIENDLHELKGRAGGGVSREIGGPDNSWVPEAVLGLDYKRQISKRQKLTLTTDYYPAWEDFNDFRVKTKADWEILLDEAPKLSLKLSALNNYDSTPNGAEPNDLDYTAVLLWKY